MINEVKELVNFYIRKNRYSGRLSGSEFNLLAKSVQNEIINENVRVDGLERVMWMNDEITSLKVFDFNIAGAGGLFPRPSGYMYLVGLSYSDGDTQTDFAIDLLRTSEFDERVQSSLLPPTEEFPIAKSIGTNFKVAPVSVDSLNVTYIKKPADPVWGYNITNDREVYNVGTSTDFELPELFINEIAMRILAKLGISVREGDVAQTATALRNE